VCVWGGGGRGLLFCEFSLSTLTLESPLQVDDFFWGGGGGLLLCTVKPVYNDHPLELESRVAVGSLSLFTGSLSFKKLKFAF
jgi:hypothetical protein